MTLITSRMDVSVLLTALRNLGRALSGPHTQLRLSVIAAFLVVWKAYKTFNSNIRVKSLVHGLPGPRNPSWLEGNLPEIYDVLNFKWHHEATRKYGDGGGRVFQVNGMFGDEQLYVADSRAMYQVLVKESALWEEPQSLLLMNRALLGDGLLASLGEHHKWQRKILNPFFAEKHMRDLLPIIFPIVNKISSIWEEKLRVGPTTQTMNVYLWASRAGLEFIARGGLGTSLDSLNDGETSTFTELVKEMVPTLSRLHVPMQLLPIVRPLFAKLPEWLGSALLRYAPFPSVRKLHQITTDFEHMSREILEQRRAAVVEELKDADKAGEKSRDILSLLLRAQMNAPEADRVPDRELMGHITTIVFAAQDTSSSASSRVLHLLAQHPETQARLRAEIRGLRGFGRSEGGSRNEEPPDYDALMRLPYLDGVVRETLRLNPPVSWIWRIARQPTTLPLRRPIQCNDGTLLSSVPIARNQGVIIGIAAAHRDERVWGADAWEWRPERWLHPVAEDGEDVQNEGAMETRPVLEDEARYPGVYSGMMTFSGGVRSCIGFKFALLSMKLVIARLIDQFEFSSPDEEIVWNMNHIAAPTVKGRETEGAQMPLKVSLAK